ncbi:MAG TPA: HTH domain-containing protein [Puia sp.]|jgi:predicted NUDIX family phosphoesterase/dephospho-CoA kinase|nr:HTH domain-containing protein [Puia sp.]
MGHFLNLAKTILEQEGRPMRVTEIIELAREKGFLDFSGGKTPHQTIKARISDDIKKKKLFSEFKRVGKGIFALREAEGNEYKATPYIKRISYKDYVLVIKSDKLSSIGIFNGVKSRNFKKYLRFLFDKKNSFFIPRIKAEKDIEHKQILSYILVEKNNEVLQFIRGVYTNAHSMLRGSLCIGFGGHVQDYDLNLFEQIDHDNGFANSTRRELLEELKIPENSINEKSLEIIGVLNDNSSEVGKSHFAIILRLNLDKVKLGDVKMLKGEKSINQLKFVPIHELGSDFEKYEYWSKLCIKSFYRKFVQISCKIHRVNNYSLENHRKVLIIVGAIGSGKTEACKILESKFGYTFISSGKILQQLMQSESIIQLGRKKFQDSAYEFTRSEDGFELLANKLLSLINTDLKQNYVIDGIRNSRTFEILRAYLGKHCSLIFVESTPDNCFKYFIKRENSDIDEEEFYEYLDHPVERDIKVLLGKANIVIYNHGSLRSYQSQLKKYFKSEFSKFNERQRTI